MSKNVKENVTSKESDIFPTFIVPVQINTPEFEQLIQLIAKDAKERRSTGSTERPNYAMDLIRKSRFGALRLPIELGGAGASLRELFFAIIRLAEADPDVAHILRFHFYQVEDLLRNPEEESSKLWLEKVAGGKIIGNAYTEISKINVGKYEFETNLLPDGDGYRLNGIKYFSTGTLYSDYVFVTASNSEGKTVSAVIPTNREGVVIEDDWDGIGQKLTGSGTTRLNNVFVHPHEVTVDSDDKTPFNSHLQLYLQAVIAGIMRNIVSDASVLVKTRKRTFSFAAADTPAADPLLQETIGQLSSKTFAAEAIVLAAADELDNAVNAVVDGNIDFGLSHDASLRAAQAKVIVDDLALKAATLLFEVGGASATRESANLDRHWRNIRTISSHNPIAYKARAIGDYVVNGNQLPLEQVYF
jgi:alkylation response protein AidB-like acyl-CoA dehydrogenase